MRAMPSPTSRTRPTSRASTSRPVLAICSRMTETISPGLNLITASLDQLVPDGLDAGADTGVVEPVAHLHDQPAQEVGVDALLQDRLAPEGLPQLAAQALLMVVVERHRGAHLDAHLSGVLLQQVAVGGHDDRQQIEPVMLVQDQEEVEHQVADASAQCRAEELRLAVAADGGAAEEGLGVGIGAD